MPRPLASIVLALAVVLSLEALDGLAQEKPAPGGKGRSEALEEKLRQESPLSLKDYRAAEEARARDLDRRFERLEEQLLRLLDGQKRLEERLDKLAEQAGGR